MASLDSSALVKIKDVSDEQAAADEEQAELESAKQMNAFIEIFNREKTVRKIAVFSDEGEVGFYDNKIKIQRYALGDELGIAVVDHKGKDTDKITNEQYEGLLKYIEHGRKRLVLDKGVYVSLPNDPELMTLMNNETNPIYFFHVFGLKKNVKGAYFVTKYFYDRYYNEITDRFGDISSEKSIIYKPDNFSLTVRAGLGRTVEKSPSKIQLDEKTMDMINKLSLDIETIKKDIVGNNNLLDVDDFRVVVSRMRDVDKGVLSRELDRQVVLKNNGISSDTYRLYKNILYDNYALDSNNVIRKPVEKKVVISKRLRL